MCICTAVNVSCVIYQCCCETYSYIFININVCVCVQQQGTVEERAGGPTQLHKYFSPTEADEAVGTVPAGGPHHLQPHSVASCHAVLHPVRAQYVQLPNRTHYTDIKANCHFSYQK